MNKEDNLKTKELREKLKAVMIKEIEDMPEALKKLEPKERLNIICKLMPFVYPKVQSIEANEGNPFDLY
jgi:hypothetical protein